MVDAEGVKLPSRVDPSRLSSILEDAGWRIVGGRRGIYTRYLPPSVENADTRTASLVIPLNVDAPDFYETMQSALLRLSEDRGFWIRTIYPRLAIDATDEFRFRKESNAPSGLIPWRKGEKLVESARRALLAGAKAYMSPGRHFVNRHAGFASRYLDQVLMGQTAPGSYIVTAYARPNVTVPLRGGGGWTTGSLELGAPNVRAVNEAIVKAIEATAEALEHYKDSGSLSGFEDGVARGISFEMTNALLGIAADSDEADVTVEWDSSISSAVNLEHRFTFDASDAVPLAQAARRLAEDATSQLFTVMGRVHLLAKKQAGSPGVFGIDSLQTDGPRKVRVRLADEEDYHEAVRAHEEDLALQVSGTLEKEGNLSWLYHATVIRTLGHVDEYSPKKSRESSIHPGQIDLLGDLQ